MCDIEKSTRGWFDGMVPKITASLGKGSHGAEYELSVPGDSLYLSSTYYVNIKLRNTAEKTPAEDGRTISIVVKRPPTSELMRELVKSDSQFHNEILFYRDFAGESEDFPRSIYLAEKPPADTVIALENVKVRGYELCPWKYDVPLEYTLAAMREIGRFHGRGYVMKEREREKFFGIVGNLSESRYETGPGSRFEEFVNLMSTRAVEYLRGRNYDKAFCDKAEACLEEAFSKIMVKSARPVEPLATMCHGDFTLNNTMFKRINGELKALLIDFALIRYGTPAIDLATFFCLCSPKELKKEALAVVLRAYHEALTGYLLENGIRDDQKYSYRALYDDFKQRGLFGFVIASFYLAMLMGCETLPPEDMFKLDTAEAAKISRKAGGDEVSKILADMLLDLNEIGCFEFVE